MSLNHSKGRLAVGFCALYDDWVKYQEQIIKSFNNLKEHWQGECFFFLAIQGYGEHNIDVFDDDANIHVYYLSILGISNARNKCIEEANKLECKWIIFHDATIFWPHEAVKFIFEHKLSLVPPKIKLQFSDSITEQPQLFDYTKRKINPIYDTYVGSILYSIEDIGTLRFNENHGPGENTTYKSGEDVLFAFDYFTLKKNFEVLESDHLVIYHPPRPTNFEKHRLYARGQGRVFRLLLSKYFSFQLAVDTVLFFGNAVIRCMLFKKNSFSILRDRLAGFFDEV